MGKLAYSDKQIEALIKGIEDGSIDGWNLPESYYNALVNYLSSACMKGFGATIDTVSKLDLPLLEELLTNVYMFSAAKTFQQTMEISSLLVDENGEVRSSREFRTLAKETYDTWNENWGLTEYNTAIAQGDSAAKWAEIERQKDVLPNLRYSTIGDACSICAPLDGLTAPVDDVIWDSIAPTNHFNCECVVLQEDENAKLTENPEDVVNPVIEIMKEKKQDIFINNVGKTGEIFTSDHPYFDVAKEYREYAKENFNLPIPEFAK
jgi:Phage Mu protein F like protein